MTRCLLTLFISLFAIVVVKGQTDSLRFPVNPRLSDKFRAAIKERAERYVWLFDNDSIIRQKYTTAYMLHAIDKRTDYADNLFRIEYTIAFHYEEMIPPLILRVNNKKEIGLTNTADLIIWERVIAKQLHFYGHGGIVHDDLFTIAGRANHLLSIITGEDFGHVSMYSKQDQLNELQQKWIQWLKELGH